MGHERKNLKSKLKLGFYSTTHSTNPFFCQHHVMITSHKVAYIYYA